MDSSNHPTSSIASSELTASEWPGFNFEMSKKIYGKALVQHLTWLTKRNIYVYIYTVQVAKYHSNAM